MIKNFKKTNRKWKEKDYQRTVYNQECKFTVSVAF